MKRLALATLVLVLGCNNAPKKITTLVVDPATITLEPNGQSALHATLKDEQGAIVSDPAVKIAWLSSAPSVIKVDDSGKLTAMGPGTATITGTIPSGALGQATVNVNAPPPPPPPPVVEAPPPPPPPTKTASKKPAKAPAPAAKSAKADGFRIDTSPGHFEIKKLF